MKPIDIRLNFRSGLPIYAQIVEQVQQQVRGGALQPGDQLPTVRQLAADLRVNFNTVARAYRLLDEAGWLSTQHGRGTYILAPPAADARHPLHRQALDVLTRRYLAEARHQGYSSSQISTALRRRLKSWRDGEAFDESAEAIHGSESED